MAQVSALPGLFDVRVKARSLAYLFAAGATLGFLTLVVPHSSEVRDTALVVLAGLAYAIAALILFFADRLRHWHIHALLVAGTVIISLANHYAGPSTLYPLLYMWTALYAFYFFALREAFAQMAFLAVAYAVVLAVQDPDSAVVRWLLAVGTPLVERVHHQAREARRSEERIRMVLDTAPDAFLTLDADGVIRTWNAAAERLFGWTASEAVGQTMRDLI